MLNVEAMSFIDDEMRPRWPDWQPTAAQVSDWAAWLKPFEFKAAVAAVRQHAAESRWKAPQPAAILTACRAGQAHRPRQKNDDDGPPTTCLVLTDPGIPPVGRVGRLIELVCLERAAARPIDADDHARRSAAATAYIERVVCRQRQGIERPQFEIYMDTAEARRRRGELIDDAARRQPTTPW